MNPTTVLTRSPLRISFFGGGSDLPVYTDGRTYSTSIDKYVYCLLRRRNDYRVIIHWRETEDVDQAHLLKHDIIRAILLREGLSMGVEISMMADVPGVGSGLGSSAATTCAVLRAVLLSQGIDLSGKELAESAASIEIDILKRRCGRQDHYASAIGGFILNRYSGGKVESSYQHIFSDSLLRDLARHFLLFSPPNGDGRNSDDILEENDAGSIFIGPDNCSPITYLEDRDFEALACMVKDHHESKRKAFPRYMDPEHCEKLDSGGLRYKLCGAGGTGHLLVATCPGDRKSTIFEVTHVWGSPLSWVPTTTGTEVLYAR